MQLPHTRVLELPKEFPQNQHSAAALNPDRPLLLNKVALRWSRVPTGSRLMKAGEALQTHCSYNNPLWSFQGNKERALTFSQLKGTNLPDFNQRFMRELKLPSCQSMFHWQHYYHSPKPHKHACCKKTKLQHSAGDHKDSLRLVIQLSSLMGSLLLKLGLEWESNYKAQPSTSSVKDGCVHVCMCGFTSSQACSTINF